MLSFLRVNNIAKQGEDHPCAGILDVICRPTLMAHALQKLTSYVLFTFLEKLAVGTIKGQGDEKARSGILVPIIVSGTFAKPKFRPDIKRIIIQQVDKDILESEPANELFEKGEVKKFEGPAKRLLKDLLKKP